MIHCSIYQCWIFDNVWLLFGIIIVFWWSINLHWLHCILLHKRKHIGVLTNRQEIKSAGGQRNRRNKDNADDLSKLTSL